MECKKHFFKLTDINFNEIIPDKLLAVEESYHCVYCNAAKVKKYEQPIEIPHVFEKEENFNQWQKKTI